MGQSGQCHTSSSGCVKPQAAPVDPAQPPELAERLPRDPVQGKRQDWKMGHELESAQV